MYKNATQKEKISILETWMPSIINLIKKDLKNDHLKKDAHFAKIYFSSKNLQKISGEEFIQAYMTALKKDEGNEKIFDMISYFWLLKNSEIYNFFEHALTKIDPNFTELEMIDNERSHEIINSSVSQFGAPATYVFSILNSVVFSEEAYRDLKKVAEKEVHEKAKHDEEELKQSVAHNDVDALKREIARLTDKYEKKLSGLQKKYIIDTEALKKQVASLQRKLAP